MQTQTPGAAVFMFHPELHILDPKITSKSSSSTNPKDKLIIEHRFDITKDTRHDVKNVFLSDMVKPGTVWTHEVVNIAKVKM